MEEKSNEKKQQTVMYKGLSVRSEEVQEVMGGGGSPPDPAEGNDDAGVRCWSRAVSASSNPGQIFPAISSTLAHPSASSH